MRTPHKSQGYMPIVLTVTQTDCTKCERRLHACNTVRRRPLSTLNGQWMLALKDKVCKTDGCSEKGKAIRPTAEAELPILARKCFGLDIVTWIGVQRTTGRRSLPEVHASLRGDFGVNISARHVAYLFQVFLALVHCVNADEAPLRQKLVDQGEIILSIDAVFFDSTSPGLVVLRDTISRRTLYSERAPKRDTELIRSLIKKVKDIGVPISGVISDKEQTQVLAVERELPGVPHQYCQTHFLKNVVKAMEADLATLGEAVSKTVTNLKQIEKALPEEAKALGRPQSELNLAMKLCEAVRVGGKASGDPILNPAPLKRIERIEAVAKVAEESVKAVDSKTTEGAQGKPLPTVGATKTRRKKKQEVCPLLLSVLGGLVELRAHLALARQLRQQMDIVRKVAHILKLNTRGTQVKRILSTYLNGLLKQKAAKEPVNPLGEFIRHLDKVANRYWAGLFHCYDVPLLPPNNNDLERDFGAFKRTERKATGRKSTAGGPLESCAEFLLEGWETVIALPNLEELLKEVTDPQLNDALRKMEGLSEPAKRKRKIQRDLNGFLSEAVEEWHKS